MLELKNISFTVTVSGEKKNILENINLLLPDSMFAVITGPNGSGKSTLAKIIAGIESPTEGSILFNGKDITKMSIAERAKEGIGFAFQQPVRFKGITIKDLIELAAGKKLNTEEACAYLSEVGLCAAEYVTREMDSSLSGGELKRIEIAMLLARNVQLSIFDEPEAGIDLWSFQNLTGVFEKMKQKKGTVIIISHQERILNIADTIIVVTSGKITAQGQKNDILPALLKDIDTCKFFK
ncbi:ATP-binding cassette domain-containing protein [Brucepastera parasyntrophica]|uniref:ABC transporter ATP-binding protein n=1 Tax=Brucepastera parasyntrophica TaxID=2880008 RepID=UPI00210D8B13|nr:ATP-binding cassette domain-containing protein [Brucepastera parasyntrophica]ULQ59511.1 ATP-binding cassette domain-containing protein [Brucepastera parasyntrophica]